jgi:diguanylate cyclase (GGDEF)-like protein
MSNLSELPGHLFRVDPLIGCGNLLGFTEWLAARSGGAARAPWSLLFLDLNFFARLNAARGHQHGDTALRWTGLVLQEETSAPVYRIGGDEFVAALMTGTSDDQSRLARRAFDRLNREAAQFEVTAPAASIALIHHTGQEPIAPGDIMAQLSAAIISVKRDRATSFREFTAAELADVNDPAALRWVARWSVERIVSLGAMLNESYRLAYTDPLTGLPNSRAAQQSLEHAVAHALATGQTVSILLIDGDNLKDYNAFGYAAGDDMIQRLGATLHSKLRPGDFLARWRVGDEFLALLPRATSEQAFSVGERFSIAVHQASLKWPLPVTISIGVASCPSHGDTVEALLREAEVALNAAKAAGKNRVKIAGE